MWVVRSRDWLRRPIGVWIELDRLLCDYECCVMVRDITVCVWFRMTVFLCVFDEFCRSLCVSLLAGFGDENLCVLVLSLCI